MIANGGQSSRVRSVEYPRLAIFIVQHIAELRGIVAAQAKQIEDLKNRIREMGVRSSLNSESSRAMDTFGQRAYNRGPLVFGSMRKKRLP